MTLLNLPLSLLQQVAARLGLPLGPVAQSAGGLFLLNITRVVLNFGISILLARTLSTSAFGAYAFAISCLGLLVIPAAFGFDTLMVREVSRHKQLENWGKLSGSLWASQWLAGVIGTAFAGLIIVTGLFVWGFGLEPILRDALLVAVCFLPIAALSKVRQAILQGFRQPLLAALPESVVQPIAFLAIFLLALIFLHQPSGSITVALNGFGVIASFVAGIILLRRLIMPEIKAAPPQRDLPRLLRQAVPMTLISSLAVIYYYTDIIVVGYVLGAEASGIYRVPVLIAAFIGFPMMALVSVVAPRLVALSADNDQNGMVALLRSTARALLLTTAALSVVAIVFGGYILGIFGPDFVDAYWILVVLALGQVAKCLFGIPSQALIAFDEEKTVAWTIGASAVLNLILSLLLIHLIGILGPALATVIAGAAVNAKTSSTLLRRHGINSTIFATRNAGG